MVYHSTTFGPLCKTILIETWPYPLEPGRLCIGSQGIALFSHISTKRPLGVKFKLIVDIGIIEHHLGHIL